MKMMRAPVLLIVFNRPDTTKVVFDAIKKAKPLKLYVFSDAPRAGNKDDEDRNEEVKKIVNEVDWECDVHKLYVEKNLGCGPGPAEAITWAFKNEDRLIILEDDCVPAQSFFPFCDELLEKYKDDERVWTISGNNYYEEIEFPYSYIFSNYGHSQGWATWKRCWDHFDLELKNLEEFLSIDGFKSVFSSISEVKYFRKFYLKILNNMSEIKHVWDKQANFAVKSNRGLSIVPQKNLVKNIGIQGTHSSKENKFHNCPVDESYKIEKHPLFVIPYYHFDQYSFQKHFLEHERLDKRIFRKLKKIIKIV